MNVHTTNKLLQHIRNIDTITTAIGESGHLDNEDESLLYQMTKDIQEIEQALIFEAIKANMERYLDVYATLESTPLKNIEDQANGWAELGETTSELKDLFDKIV